MSRWFAVLLLAVPLHAAVLRRSNQQFDHECPVEISAQTAPYFNNLHNILVHGSESLQGARDGSAQEYYVTSFKEELQCMFATLIEDKCGGQPSRLEQRQIKWKDACLDPSKDMLAAYNLMTEEEKAYFNKMKNAAAERQIYATYLELAGYKELVCMLMKTIDDNCINVSFPQFATPVPKGLDPVAGAPLICAGITVYTPLATYATHVSKVLIVSLGGLGGMALQFAAKMGCEVVCMSRGPKKKEQALALGAHSHIDSTSQEQLKASKGEFDLILDTSPATADMSVMLDLLAADGRYVTVGLPTDGKKMEIPNLGLVPEAKGVAGSVVGSISQIEDMMIFAARHGIVADCETMPMSQLNEALQMLNEGRSQKMRIVLVREEKLEAYKSGK